MPAPSDAERTLVEAVIRDLPGGVLMTDAAGRIMHANRAGARILGAKVDALVGRTLAEVHPRLLPMLGTASKAELELPDPEGGPPRVVGFSSRPIEAAAGGMLVSFADITADKARRREEGHRRRLADLGKVVASVAHEIRNPVFAITSLAQVLRDEDAVAGDPDLRLIVEKIREEAVRVSRLVEDLLAFGRARPLVPRPIDVVGELRGLVADLRDVLPRIEGDVNVPVTLVVDEASPVPPQLELDPDALRGIAVNLVRNARRAVAERMSADARDGSVEITLGYAEGVLRIEVRDDGIGIEPADLPRIFEAFYSRDPKGTGLGLAIVKKLVDQLGGQLSVESTPGVGTCVRLRLPAAPPRPSRRGRPAAT